MKNNRKDDFKMTIYPKEQPGAATPEEKTITVSQTNIFSLILGLAELLDLDKVEHVLAEIPKSLKSIKELVKDERFLGRKEVAAILGCSLTEAGDFMHRPDFPLIECGRDKVSATAFFCYCQGRRTKKEPIYYD